MCQAEIEEYQKATDLAQFEVAQLWSELVAMFPENKVKELEAALRRFQIKHREFCEYRFQYYMAQEGYFFEKKE
jgi:hypothetical protein